jgi:hypothetical protein
LAVSWAALLDVTWVDEKDAPLVVTWVGQMDASMAVTSVACWVVWRGVKSVASWVAVMVECSAVSSADWKVALKAAM